VALPDRLVEAVIALSIATVAAENLFLRPVVSRRWLVSFCFGLVHGFSSALRELRLKSDPRRRHRHAADSTRHHGVEIGDAPGLGVTLDEAKVAEFAVKP